MTKDKGQKTLLLVLFIFALLPRLVDLGQFLTSDENGNIFWAGTTVIEAVLRGDLRGTYWHFYPGVIISWMSSLGMVGAWLIHTITNPNNQPFTQYINGDILNLLIAVRLPYAILTALFIPAVYYFLRRWFYLVYPPHHSHQTDYTAYYLTITAALLIAFDPFFLAHSRVIHGDAPVTVFMVLSILPLFLYFRDGQKKDLIISAIMGALAALTKAPGQFMAPFIILIAMGNWIWQATKARNFNGALAKRCLIDIVVWGVVAFITFFILWPSMWVDPIGTLSQMINETFGKVDEGHLVFFMGQPTLNPGFWFYPYVIFFRLTPLTSLGLLLSVGVVLYDSYQLARFKTSVISTPIKHLALLLLFFVLTLFFLGTLSDKKQDRYLLPLFPVIDILAAIGWFGLWNLFKLGLQKLNQLTWVWVGVIVICQLILSIPWHPYYLAYFNPLMGGLSRAVETTLVGWGEGMEQVATYLNQKPNAEKLYVASTPSQTLLPYFKGQGENFYTNDIALRADYVVIYRAQQQRLAPSPEIVQTYMNREAEKIISIKGVPYAWIYPNTPLIFTDVPDWATLTNIGFGDSMRLAGYQFKQQDNTATLSFFWHALLPIEQATGECYETEVEYFTATVCPRLDYTISARIVASDGTVVGQHDSWPANGLLPTSQWRVNDYIQDQHSFTFDTNLPSGKYTVMLVVYESETQVVLAGPIEVAPLKTN